MIEKFRQDALLFERVKKERLRQCTNFIDLNKEEQGKFTLQSRTSGVSRLNAQIQEAELRRALGENFRYKYKLFLTYKWDILKVFKQNLLQSKLKA